MIHGLGLRLFSCAAYLLLFVFLSACSNKDLYISKRFDSVSAGDLSSQAEVDKVLFFFGDLGEGDAISRFSRRLAREHLGKHDPLLTTTVVLGTRSSIRVPDTSSVHFERYLEELSEQLSVFEGYKGSLFFIPGYLNADVGGDATFHLQAYQRLVEDVLSRKVFRPRDGFPGPGEKRLDDESKLYMLNTEWWFNSYEKPFGETEDYELESASDFIAEIEREVKKNDKEHLFFATQHPLSSIGEHGGFFALKRHLLPLPVVGTGIATYRRFVGNQEDLSHPLYRSYRLEMNRILSRLEDPIVVSGHERNFQYFRQPGERVVAHHITASTMGEPRFVSQGRGWQFTASRSGFVKIIVHKDDSIWLEAWSPHPKTEEGERIYRGIIREPQLSKDDAVEKVDVADMIPDFRDSMITVAANPKYDNAGFVKGALLGYHNRDLWSAAVRVPVIDIETEKGGLTPIKIGGRGQSNTIRFKGNDGHEYMLRSVDKVAGKTWPSTLRNTFVNELTQDQFSFLNPYSALAVPPLAEAAGVYHTYPKIFYVPKDPRLSGFSEKLSDELALFEIRPDEDLSDFKNFGYSKDVISTAKMWRLVNSDQDFRVDQRKLARARLFDMLIADWDRHEDQWRWAAQEPPDKKGKIYEPIPRDRDVAFMKMNGLIPTFAKYAFLVEYQDFREHFGYFKGFNKNSFRLARRFTNEVSADEWAEIARDIQNRITDEVIEEALAQWPDSIQALTGEYFKRILKIRRDKLVDVSQRYYRILAEVVDIPGTHKKDRFEVNRLDDDWVEVSIFKLSKKGKREQRTYHRVFNVHETREIRLYGLRDDDTFYVDGSVKNSLVVRIIGGTGQDSIVDHSSVKKGRSKKTVVYDTPQGTTLDVDAETKVLLKDDPRHLRYNPGDIPYDLTHPVVFISRDRDNGLFIGGGVKVTKHGFRKEPHAVTHQIMANFASFTQAFNVVYSGSYIDFMGELDGGLEMKALAPNNIRNFFGLGNNTRNDIEEDDFNQAEIQRLSFNPFLIHQLDEFSTLKLGTFLEYTLVEENADGITGQPLPGLRTPISGDFVLSGYDASWILSTIDDPGNPKIGFYWDNTLSTKFDLNHPGNNFTSFSSAFSTYLSPSFSPQFTIAFRSGIKHVEGKFPFFESASLGGISNLRGFRADRFNGETAFFNNFDLRFKLFETNNYFIPGEVGMVMFTDVGRVWTDGESSRFWHTGYGGGLWYNLYKLVIIRVEVGVSTETTNTLVGMGFFF